MEHDVVVVGCGCVGASTTRHLVERTDLEVAVVEKEHRLAERAETLACRC